VTRPARVDGQPGPVVVAVPLGARTGRVALPGPAGQAGGEFPGLAGARGGGDRVAGGHRQHITNPAGLQVSAQARVGAVHLIAGDPGGRNARAQSPGDHVAGQSRLGREPPLARNARCGAPARVSGPGPGQIQFPVDQRVPCRRGVGQKHRHLAVLHPPRGARILALHPGASPALLEVSRFIDHQHPVRAAQVLHHVPAHIVADRIGVPPGRRQQVLHPVRGGIPGLLSDRPAVLAPQPRQ